jgi:AcrR family transcriptional regulator
MYKQCNSEVTAQRQRHLENCLLERMRATPYPQIAVGDICKLAGVPRGMFYRYFDSKKDALDALVDHTLLDFITSVVFSSKPEPEDSFGMKAVLDYWQAQEPLLEVLTKNRKESLLFERSIICCTQDAHLLAPYLEKAGHSTEPEVMAFCINGILSAIMVWHRSGYAKSAEEMAEILRKLLEGPIVVRADCV